MTSPAPSGSPSHERKGEPRSPRWWVVVALVALALSVAPLVGERIMDGSADDWAPTKAMKADPLADYLPPGAALVHTREEPLDQADGLIELAPTMPATYDLEFHADPSITEEALVRHAIEAAREAGWQVREDDEHGLRGYGTKELSTGSAHLSIQATANIQLTETDAVSMLSIHMSSYK